MNEYRFRQMKSGEIPACMDRMFSILYGNMHAIAPTGDSFDEDYRVWTKAAVPLWKDARNRVVLIFCGGTLCGYFQYRLTEDTFKMDEVQFLQEYQGSGLFESLFRYLTSIVPEGIRYTEAYARKENRKSAGILKHLGLAVIGENANGSSWRFRGEYKTLKNRYGGP